MVVGMKSAQRTRPLVERVEPRLLFSAVPAALPIPSPHVRAIHYLVTRAAADPSDDGSGDTATSAPSITPPSGLSVAVGAQLNYRVIAQGSPTPSIHLISGPGGMKLHRGVLLWSPTAAQMGTQSVTLLAKSKAGRSRVTFTVTVTTDQTPPTAPYASIGTGATTTSVPLVWTASTDNVAVAGYRVYLYTPAVYRGHSGRDGGITLVSPAKYTLVADHLQTPAYTVTGLAPGSSQQYVVAAYDAAGNQADSNIGTATTLLGPSVGYSSDGVNIDPPITVAVGQSLYLTLTSSGDPAPTLSLASAPAGVVFTPGDITNSQLTIVTPHLTWIPTAGQIGTQQIVMLATNSVGTYTLKIDVNVVKA
jgi:hypothetical protein